MAPAPPRRRLWPSRPLPAARARRERASGPLPPRPSPRIAPIGVLTRDPGPAGEIGRSERPVAALDSRGRCHWTFDRGPDRRAAARVNPRNADPAIGPPIWRTRPPRRRPAELRRTARRVLLGDGPEPSPALPLPLPRLGSLPELAGRIVALPDEERPALAIALGKRARRRPRSESAAAGDERGPARRRHDPGMVVGHRSLPPRRGDRTAAAPGSANAHPPTGANALPAPRVVRAAPTGWHWRKCATGPASSANLSRPLDGWSRGSESGGA